MPRHQNNFSETTQEIRYEMQGYYIEFGAYKLEFPKGLLEH